YGSLICLAALPSVLGADTVVEAIIDCVTNQLITRSESQKRKEQIKHDVHQQEEANADNLFTDRQTDALRALIEQQLVLDNGKHLRISGDTELIKKLDDMRKQMNLESMEELEKAAQAEGVFFEDFKQNMRNQIITQQVIGKEVGGKMTI